jgi:hypothetical protein
MRAETSRESHSSTKIVFMAVSECLQQREEDEADGASNILLERHRASGMTWDLQLRKS